GSYQLIISDIEPAGFGELAKNFVILKQKLDKQGLTAKERKRPIPSWAKHIAVVTSATGAAIRDVLTTLKRRAPFIAVTVYPTMVQGEKASEQIIQALSKANENRRTAENVSGHDVILLVRGGGSIEDLQSFNDENLAYAVANSELPVVTGVGHETDFTIVDFVSDYRAPTPTGAAEIASPDKLALKKILKQKQQQLISYIQGRITQNWAQLTHCKNRLSVQHPVSVIEQQNQRLDELDSRMKQTFYRRLTGEKNNLQQFTLRLASQSPQRQLQQSHSDLSKLSNQLKQAMFQHVIQYRRDLQLNQQKLQQSLSVFSRYQQQIKGLHARLILLSPLGILDRGYALVFDEKDKLLQSAKRIQLNDTVIIKNEK
ncbi:MAG: exodeoxyribonuclease VII large subunit, partial [Gammaproteobacteria bacterium]